MNCYRKVSRRVSFSWAVVPFAVGPLLEVLLYWVWKRCCFIFAEFVLPKGLVVEKCDEREEVTT